MSKTEDPNLAMRTLRSLLAFRYFPHENELLSSDIILADR